MLTIVAGAGECCVLYMQASTQAACRVHCRVGPGHVFEAVHVSFTDRASCPAVLGLTNIGVETLGTSIRELLCGCVGIQGSQHHLLL